MLNILNDGLSVQQGSPSPGSGKSGLWWRAWNWLGLLIVVPFAAVAYAGETGMKMTIRSSAFAHAQPIPRIYTCEGQNISPPLAWRDVPAGAQSLVLIMDDPDAPDPVAPKMIWVHWVLYNLPATSVGLSESVRVLPHGTLEGLNDWHQNGYGGPCPPVGQHRYFYKLYALDVMLPDLKRPTRQRLEQAMLGHILAEAQLVGTYRKER